MEHLPSLQLCDSEVKIWLGNPVVELISGTLFVHPLEGDLEELIPVEQGRVSNSPIMALLPVRRSKGVQEVSRHLLPFAADIIEAKVVNIELPQYYALLVMFVSG